MQEGLAASAIIVAATAAIVIVVAATATKAAIATAAYQQEDDDQDPTAVSTKTVHKRTSLKLLYCILCWRSQLCYKLGVRFQNSRSISFWSRLIMRFSKRDM